MFVFYVKSCPNCGNSHEIGLPELPDFLGKSRVSIRISCPSDLDSAPMLIRFIPSQTDSSRFLSEDIHILENQ